MQTQNLNPRMFPAYIYALCLWFTVGEQIMRSASNAEGSGTSLH